MTIFQLLMLGASAFFAFRIYEHIQNLRDLPPENEANSYNQPQSADAFSPFNAQDLIAKADEAFEAKDMQKALALLIEANEKEGSNPDVVFKIGYILQQLRDFDGSLKYYKEALELDKTNEFIHNSMASIYRQNGEFVSAKMHLNESLALDDTNAVTYYNYGNLLVDMTHEEEAKDMYKKAIEINEDFLEARDELEKLF